MIQIGDTVRLIDEPGQGVVKAIDDDNILVTIDGLDLSYNRYALVKVQFDEMVAPSISKIESNASDKLKAIDARNRLRKIRPIRQATYELDLHIEELLDRHEHMTNAQILEHQMNCCKRFVAEAREKKFKQIVLIHGVGEGVLRSEIRHWLDTQDKISYHDAAYRTYGYGATEVILWR